METEVFFNYKAGFKYTKDKKQNKKTRVATHI